MGISGDLEVEASSSAGWGLKEARVVAKRKQKELKGG